MVHKKILGTAVLAALGLNSAGVLAGVSFFNVTDAHSTATPTLPAIVSAATNPAQFEGVGFETHGTEKIVVSGVGVDGIVYAAEMFGGSGLNLPYHDTTGQHVAVAYQIDAPIKEDFDLTFTLSNGAKFSEALLSIDNANDTVEYDCTGATDCDRGALGQSVTYRVKAKTKVIDTNSVLALAYQITNTGALATPGETIEMRITFETEIGVKVAAPRTITVAKSAKALGDISIVPEDIGTVKISVASGQTEFVGENPPNSTEGAFVSPEEVILGYIKMGDSGGGDIPKAQDGVTAWALGQNEGKIDEENTTLTITEGQFAASATGSSGRVYLDFETGFQDAVVSEVEGKWIATWKLGNSAMEAISTDPDTVPIKMKVDGSTAINVTENPPVATLNIDFVEDFMENITGISADLRRFRLDGTVCTLYNIPGSNAPDAINIRITNDTNTAGAITIGMWGEDGTELIPSGTPLLGDGATGSEDVLQPYATWHISAAELESFSGGPWQRRAVATISSTISKLEAFALLRHKATGINSNLSGGASGNACPDD